MITMMMITMTMMIMMTMMMNDDDGDDDDDDNDDVDDDDDDDDNDGLVLRRYLLLRASDEFYDEHGRYPGYTDDTLEADIGAMRACVLHTYTGVVDCTPTLVLLITHADTRAHVHAEQCSGC